MQISVVICTHNPDVTRLHSCLQGLKGQTLRKTKWELLLVDNNSTPSVQQLIPKGYGLKIKIIKEKKLGLTRARLRGIKASRGALIIFVDDDNILSKDYLKNVLQKFSRHKKLGVCGGQYFGVFENGVPEYARPYLHLLCVGAKLKKDLISNKTTNDVHLAGAGLALRKEVAYLYVNEVSRSPLRRQLDRTGFQLLSGGDTDICNTALKNGFQLGKFKNLWLRHLIPEKRLKKNYLLKIQKGMATSNLLIKKIYKQPIDIKISRIVYYLVLSFFYKSFDGRMMRASLFGQIYFLLKYGKA